MFVTADQHQVHELAEDDAQEGQRSGLHVEVAGGVDVGWAVAASFEEEQEVGVGQAGAEETEGDEFGDGVLVDDVVAEFAGFIAHQVALGAVPAESRDGEHLGGNVDG